MIAYMYESLVNVSKICAQSAKPERRVRYKYIIHASTFKIRGYPLRSLKRTHVFDHNMLISTLTTPIATTAPKFAPNIPAPDPSPFWPA